MSSLNPYAPPRADVADVPVEEAFQPVKAWSARGRIGRLRYLSYQGAAYLLFLGLTAVGGIISAMLKSPNGLIGMILLCSVPYCVLTVLLTIQRCHDMDWTGWTSLLALIPLVGLLFWVMPGTPGANRFGAPPPPNSTGVRILAWLGVVLLLMAILMAISVPAYMDYQQRARAAQAR